MMTETKVAERTVYVPALAGDEDAATLERELGKMEGVVEVEVDAARHEVRIVWTEATVDWPAVRWFMEQMGYPPGGEHGGG